MVKAYQTVNVLWFPVNSVPGQSSRVQRRTFGVTVHTAASECFCRRSQKHNAIDVVPHLNSMLFQVEDAMCCILEESTGVDRACLRWDLRMVTFVRVLQCRASRAAAMIYQQLKTQRYAAVFAMFAPENPGVTTLPHSVRLRRCKDARPHAPARAQHLGAHRPARA